MILSALIFISMAHAETGSVAINAMQSARYEDEKARQQLEHAINKLPGFNRNSTKCKYNPECSSLITDWVKENSTGFISPAQKCEKENLKRIPPKYGIISRYEKKYPRFGKMGAACSLGNELDDKLYASKYYYSLLRLEEAQFSAINQVAAIDSLFTSSPLSGIGCDKIGISTELSGHCQKIKSECNNIKQDDFNKLATETANAEKILKDAEKKLVEAQTKFAVASRNVARIGSQGGLDQLKEAEEKIKSYQQIISITKKNYPWLGGEVYKKERGNYLFKDSSQEQAAYNIKRALRAQLEETRKVLVEQKIPSITEATVCITNKDVSCNLNKIRKTVRDTPELVFTEDQASPEQDFFKTHQCISNSEKKTEENIQLARDIGLTAASLALIPFSGGSSLGAAGVTAGRVAVGARSIGATSNLARAATFGVEGFWTFDSGRRAYEACSGKRSEIELAQNDKNAQLCPGYSNKFNQSVRSFDSCLAESLYTTLQVGAAKSTINQLRTEKNGAELGNAISNTNSRMEINLSDSIRKRERVTQIQLRKTKLNNLPSVTVRVPMEKQLTVRGIKTKIRYSLEQRAAAVREGRIYENIPVTQLPRNSGRTEYTYVLTEDGSLIFGKVQDQVEYGIKHFQLANGRKVKAAGEMSIEEFEGSIDIQFNMSSGTFSRDLAQMNGYDESKIIEVLTESFSLDGADNIQYLSSRNSILSIENPSPEDLKKYCSDGIFEAIEICQ